MITDIRTVGVPVTDQDRAIDFFVGTLGFEKAMDAPIDETTRWVEVAAPGATTSVALVKGPGTPGPGVDTGVRFVVPDATPEHQRLVDRGVDIGELLVWEGVPTMFTFDDPDGNRFYVVESSG
jgi:catechol 2,3-dioxygenase-like lactoylglutathione lyase family enzyme